jgi:ketosteroid isomerase-like protein
LSNALLLTNFYAAIKSGDAPALALCVHPKFELDWQGSAAIPWSGRWHGSAGLLEFFQILNQHIEVLEVQRLHEFSDASVTVIVLQGRWRSKAGGVNITAKASNLFTFEDGLVRSYTVMNNSAAFAEAIAH